MFVGVCCSLIMYLVIEPLYGYCWHTVCLGCDCGWDGLSLLCACDLMLYLPITDEIGCLMVATSWDCLLVYFVCLIWWFVLC